MFLCSFLLGFRGEGCEVLEEGRVVKGAGQLACVNVHYAGTAEVDLKSTGMLSDASDHNVEEKADLAGPILGTVAGTVA